MRKWAVFLLAAAMMIFCATALAETVTGNLEERFGSELTLTYQDEQYQQRKRMTNVLFIGTEQDPDTQQHEAVMLILLAVDDNQKLITPVMLDHMSERMILVEESLTKEFAQDAVQGEDSLNETADSEAADSEEMPAVLGRIVSDYEDPMMGAQAMVDAVNGMLPAALIEDYVMLDLAGLELLDGRTDTDYEARARAIANSVSEFSGGEINRLLGELSGYLTTNMKSGALMKIVDKADRYDRRKMLRLTVREDITAEDERLTLLTDEVWMQMTVETFFEKKRTSW